MPMAYISNLTVPDDAPTINWIQNALFYQRRVFFYGVPFLMAGCLWFLAACWFAIGHLRHVSSNHSPTQQEKDQHRSDWKAHEKDEGLELVSVDMGQAAILASDLSPKTPGLIRQFMDSLGYSKRQIYLLLGSSFALNLMAVFGTWTSAFTMRSLNHGIDINKGYMAYQIIILVCQFGYCFNLYLYWRTHEDNQRHKIDVKTGYISTMFGLRRKKCVNSQQPGMYTATNPVAHSTQNPKTTSANPRYGSQDPRLASANTAHGGTIGTGQTTTSGLQQSGVPPQNPSSRGARTGAFEHPSGDQGSAGKVPKGFAASNARFTDDKPSKATGPSSNTVRPNSYTPGEIDFASLPKDWPGAPGRR